MKKLFLASSASVSLDLIHPLLTKQASQQKVAFIPTAGDTYKDNSFVYVDRNKLVEMGFNVIDVSLAKTQGSDLEIALRDMDMILVAGGNVFYLLDQVRKSGFDVLVKKLIDKGVIYIGSSAGSVLCCPTIEGAKRFDNTADAPDLTDYTGLHFFDKILIPHAQKEKYAERIKQTIEEMNAKGLEFIALTDEQAVVIDGDDCQIVSV